MKILYLQCNMGAAGDMLTASLASLLPDPNVYLDTINGTGLDGVKTTLVRSASKGMAGLHAHVVINGVEEETLLAHPPVHHAEEDHHHHHHHADEVFTSWGIETPNTYSAEDIEKILTALDSGEYGAILRAKGMVPAPDGTWVYYDYVPEEHDIRSGKPEVTGKICVIGSKLDEDKLAELFRK